jgi:hypothetical protein
MRGTRGSSIGREEGKKPFDDVGRDQDQDQGMDGREGKLPDRRVLTRIQGGMLNCLPVSVLCVYVRLYALFFSEP